MNAKSVAQSAEYYLGLDYAVSLRRLAEADGGGYVATIPQLGEKTFVAVGDTREETLDALEELRQYLIPLFIEEGAVLPEPQEDTDDLSSHSGSLMLRLPRLLHAQLAAQAKKNGCSINKLATQYLTQSMAGGVTLDNVRQAIHEMFSEEAHKYQAGATPASVFNAQSHSGWRIGGAERGILSSKIADYLDHEKVAY